MLIYQKKRQIDVTIEEASSVRGEFTAEDLAVYL